MAHSSAAQRALESLKDSYARGFIGLDTFEARVTTLVSAEAQPVRSGSLLDALLAHRGVAYIGRSPECQLVLADDTVSRRHVLVRRCPEGALIIDLESTNGTLVNGRPVTRAGVRAGDRLTLGEAEIVL